MHLVLVSRRFAPCVGGAERLLEYFATALLRQGVRVTVLTSRWSKSLPAEEEHHGIRLIRLPTARLRIWGTIHYMAQLRHWLANHAQCIDICYVSMLKHGSFACMRAARAARFPVVLRCEGAGACGDVAWQRTARFGATIRKTCRQADRIVALSPLVRRELLDAGYPPERIVEIPNGVPLPAGYDPEAVATYRRRTLPSTPEPALLALFAGRLSPEKNLSTLIAAWAVVRRTESAARLVLVGEGPERSGLEREAAAAGLSDSVEFAGLAANVEPFLRAADVFILPSTSEGMSIALLEAMALGVPVVASDIAGNRGLIRAGVHGLLSPPDAPEELAAAILQQFRERPPALAMARAARERVAAEFSIDAMARRHLELFQTLLAGRRTGDRGGC